MPEPKDPIRDLMEDLDPKKGSKKAKVRGAVFIERPEEMDVRDGELCWHNGNRVCGADCVAYNTDEIDEIGSPVQGPTKCLFIVLAGQMGSGVTALVQLMAKPQMTATRPGPPPMPPPPDTHPPKKG